MVTKELINPSSIAVIGASNDIATPGGSLIKNLIISNFRGNIFPISNKESTIQGIRSFKSLMDIPDTDLAIIADDNGDCLLQIEILCEKKSCKAIIVYSDVISSSHLNEDQVKERINEICNTFSVTLIGPNSSGIANSNYSGLYTRTLLRSDGSVEIISSSRTLISFFVESAPKYGVKISGVYSVGYSQQTTQEDILAWMDDNWKDCKGKVIALNIEKVYDSVSMMNHCHSLISKGAHIVGILASPTKVVNALFTKCGIIRAYGREEMLIIAAILSKGKPMGERITILTQAGGPAVMLSDVFKQSGVTVPNIFFEDYNFGKTAGQISSLIEKYDNDPNSDATVVIFGGKGMSDVSEISNVIFRVIDRTSKPVYPLFSSESSYQEYINEFHSRGGISFSDEVVFGRALAKVIKSTLPNQDKSTPAIDKYLIKRVIDESPDGWMSPFMVEQLLDASGINRIRQVVALSEEDVVNAAISIGYPVVLKVVGPLHKTEVDGVSLNISDEHTLRSEYERMSNIEGVTGFIVQPMQDENFTELFIRAVRKENFSPLILCSLGGIFADVMEDITYCLAPVSAQEADKMIESLKAYPILKGYRGQEGVNQITFNDAIRRVSALCIAAPEIEELELNPLFGDENQTIVAGARIRIKK
ncbi:MAG: acetate--CoA ligase family protein [Bacteroidales bacterium]|nr:acetate--CoA ligase family protein [Bacteroidales bacterium]